MNTGVEHSAVRGPHGRETGTVIHNAARYDFFVALLTFGRERAFRERVVDLARIGPGESVLDVACGTGTLAVAEKRRVGAHGKVCAIDASPEMIRRARRKATRKGVEVGFENAVADSLPFPDGEFDVVTATMMLHHLPGESLRRSLLEMRRVLKPGGRILFVDFGGDSRERRGLIARVHRRIQFDLDAIIPVLDEIGCRNVASGTAGFRDLKFILATRGDAGSELVPAADATAAERKRSPARYAAALALVLSPALLYAFLFHASVPSGIALGVVLVVALKHLGVLGALFGPGYVVYRRRAAAQRAAAATAPTAQK